MNILFLLKSLNMGGVEIVTATLANKFVCEGHNVCIFSFFEPSAAMTERIDKRVMIFQLRKFKVSDENVQAMRAVMVEEKINIVINQWGLPVVPIKVARKAAKGLDIKIITVYHNMPNANGRVQTVDIKLSQTSNPFKRLLLKAERRVFEMITAAAMRYNYNQSDRYMVLSPSFVDVFTKFTGIKDTSKLIAQTNPVTIDTEGFVYDAAQKQKEIVYVGRIDKFQKRVHRVIETWACLEAEHPDWQLTLVGDGEEKDNVEAQVAKLGLQRVNFEGFQSPIPYYKRASILILCSEFEGFPLVLAEAMSFGVVPVVYGSYPAVYDIIEDGVNGAVLPKDGEFNAVKMAERIRHLMGDSALLQQCAIKAVETSKNYDIGIIYKQWMDVMSA